MSEQQDAKIRSVVPELIEAMTDGLTAVQVAEAITKFEIVRDGRVRLTIHTTQPGWFTHGGPIKLGRLRDALRAVAGEAIDVKVVGEEGAGVADTAGERITFNCSFCGKNQTVVKKLIAGPGIYICDECVDLCNEIIGEEVAQPRGRKPPVELRPIEGLSSDEALVELARAAEVVRPVEPYIEEVVSVLRKRGVSWMQIGKALGMSRQGAWARYSGED